MILDYEVQRSLRGAAKRIWVQLESYPGWRGHRIARAGSDAELAETVSALTDEPRGVTVEPAEGEDSQEVQTLVLALDAEVHEAFGLTHGNRKRALENACTSILATDLTYLRADIRLAPRSKRRFELHLARAAGAFRQERHRTALKARAGGRQAKAQEAPVTKAA